MNRYEYEPHDFYFSKLLGKQVCSKCGLVGLNNKATDWCVDKGCNNFLHPQYRKTLTKLTKRVYD